MTVNISVDAAQHAVIRDLDAYVARLEDLSDEDWQRPTPCEGWTIHDLSDHLAGTSRALGEGLWAPVAARTGQAPEPDAPAEPTARGSHRELVVRIIHGRNILNHTMSQLIESDAPFEIRPAKDGAPALTTERLLGTACVEIGTHRWDLEVAMGERYAGLSTEAVTGAQMVIASNLVPMANSSGTQPDVPWSIHLVGDTIDLTLGWDGSAWSNAGPSSAGTTEIRGEDSAIALYVMGRITADDDRLAVTGDRDMAARFKEFAPGPH